MTKNALFSLLKNRARRAPEIGSKNNDFDEKIEKITKNTKKSKKNQKTDKK